MGNLTNLGGTAGGTAHGIADATAGIAAAETQNALIGNMNSYQEAMTTFKTLETMYKDGERSRLSMDIGSDTKFLSKLFNLVEGFRY